MYLGRVGQGGYTRVVHTSSRNSLLVIPGHSGHSGCPKSRVSLEQGARGPRMTKNDHFVTSAHHPPANGQEYALCARIAPCLSEGFLACERESTPAGGGIPGPGRDFRHNPVPSVIKACLPGVYPIFYPFCSSAPGLPG